MRGYSFRPRMSAYSTSTVICLSLSRSLSDPPISTTPILFCFSQSLTIELPEDAACPEELRLVWDSIGWSLWSAESPYQRGELVPAGTATWPIEWHELTSRASRQVLWRSRA